MVLPASSSIALIEIFANQGEAAMIVPILPKAENKELHLSAKGGTVKATHLDIHPMQSTWESRDTNQR